MRYVATCGTAGFREELISNSESLQTVKKGNPRCTFGESPV
jgi:hypothetical protein